MDASKEKEDQKKTGAETSQRSGLRQQRGLSTERYTVQILWQRQLKHAETETDSCRERETESTMRRVVGRSA